MLSSSPPLFLPEHLDRLSIRYPYLLGDDYSVEKRMDEEDILYFILTVFHGTDELDYHSFLNEDDPSIPPFIQGTVFRHLIERALRR